jgi:pyruvate dehydrogenase E1 component beta subunit
MMEAINRGLWEEMEKDPSVMVLGEDVGREGGVFRVTDGLQSTFGPKRVVDTPLAESGIVGVALGLAVKGFKPVAELQFMGFLPPALDQVISHVSRIRNRSRGRYTCPMVIRMPYGGGIHAPEHHSESIEAMLAHVPGIKVVIPSTPHDAKGLSGPGALSRAQAGLPGHKRGGSGWGVYDPRWRGERGSRGR